MSRAGRWLLAGALALAPVTAAASLASVPARPFVDGVPWCCAVRGNMTERPAMPTLPARAVADRLRRRRVRTGRYTGPARRKTPRTGCFHCGAPTPNALTERVAGRLHTFCGPACVAACRDYHAAGLAQLYVAGPPGRAVPAAPDDAPAVSGPVTLLVTGMHCGACVWILERALMRVPGVEAARVQLATGRARVSAIAGMVSVEALQAAVARAGYSARLYDPAVAEEPLRAARDLWLSRLAVTGFGAVATMFMAEPLYYDYAHVAAADTAMWQLLRYLGMVVATATGAYGALPFLRGAWAACRRGVLGMDVLISLGLVATYMASVWGFVTHGPVYFDSLTMFLFLIVLGRFAEAIAKGRVYSAMEHLLGARERTARVERGGLETVVPASALQPGDVVLVGPGEAVAADGVVLRGRSSLDESMLTGESRPVPKGPGDALTGGTLNVEGAIAMRVSRVGADTTFERLHRLVAEADGQEARVRRLADAAGHWGTLGVAAVAAATAVGWAYVAPSHALSAAVAVLIVTCPCALGLATPAALTLAVGRALKRGVLFKRAEAIEDLTAVRRVVFDKTGTLTTGEPEVVAVLGLADEALALAAVLEAGSEHPLGRAVVRYARYRGVPLGPVPDDFAATPGLGVSATVGGKRALAGRGEWLVEAGYALPAPWASEAEAWMEAGRTLVWVAQGERVLGALALGDRVRPEAAATVAALKARGLAVTMLTGDNEGAARSVARALGIDEVVAGMRPEGKLAAIRGYQRRGDRVAMVGDGLNDAPALAVADVGLAMARGADLALTSADVVLVGARLGAVEEAFGLADSTFRVIRANFWISGIYNAVAVPLAVLGLVTPLAAAVMMPLSSLAVLLSTLRLRR